MPSSVTLSIAERGKSHTKERNNKTQLQKSSLWPRLLRPESQCALRSSTGAVRPAPACTASEDGGQTTRAHLVEAFKPFCCRTRDSTRETERQITHRATLSGSGRLRLASTGDSSGTEQGVFLGLFFSFVRAPSSRLTRDMNSFWYDAKIDHPQNVHGGTIRLFTAKQQGENIRRTKSQRGPVPPEAGEPLRQAGAVTASLGHGSAGVE